MIELVGRIFQRSELTYMILNEVVKFAQHQRCEGAIEGTLNVERPWSYDVTS